jgi:hypothetical protein
MKPPKTTRSHDQLITRHEAELLFSAEAERVRRTCSRLAQRLCALFPNATGAERHALRRLAFEPLDDFLGVVYGQSESRSRRCRT